MNYPPVNDVMYRPIWQSVGLSPTHALIMLKNYVSKCLFYRLEMSINELSTMLSNIVATDLVCKSSLCFLP